MGCPVHIWLPLMAAAAPAATAARHRLRSLVSRGSSEPETAPELKRWAPVGTATSGADSTHSNS
jgi:hypothetical protein